MTRYFEDNRGDRLELKGLAMGDADREEILRVLQEGEDALTEALKDVDESMARRRPRPESWSVLECVEHLSLTEAALLRRLREARPSDSSHEDRGREERFRELAMNRLRRIEAPELVTPGNDSESLAQAMGEFNAARRETVRFIQEFPGELRWSLATHPLITRRVNCYEMLLLMALHPRRHALQIAETRALLANLDRQR